MKNSKDRYEKMDDFLLACKQFAIENPNLSFGTVETKYAIYKGLIKLGVVDEGRDFSKEGVFSAWIDRYRNNPGIDVFVDENWPSFCQFTNKDTKMCEINENAIKMYIPLDSSHIEYGAQIIFDYLAEKDIPHHSKIGKEIRFDDIVVRLKNVDDAIDLLKFVNSQPFLMEGLIDANPFAFSLQNIAFVSDRAISYNDTIASLIGTYVNDRKNAGRLDNIGITDFMSFSVEYYNERFKNFDRIDETVADFDVPKGLTKAQAFVNLKEVTSLFLSSLGRDYSFGHYVMEYQKLSNSALFDQEVAIVDAYISQKENETKQMMDNLLLNMLDTVSNQKDEKYALLALNTYLQTGREYVLTRENGVRESFEYNSVREYLNNEITAKNVTLEEYCNRVKEDRKKTCLENAVLETCSKYQKAYELGQTKESGPNFIANGLTNLMEFGTYNGFTRDKNIRQNLMQYVSRDDAISIMQQTVGLEESRAIMSSPNGYAMLAQNYVQIILEKQRTNELNTTTHK